MDGLESSYEHATADQPSPRQHSGPTEAGREDARIGKEEFNQDLPDEPEVQIMKTYAYKTTHGYGNEHYDTLDANGYDISYGVLTFWNIRSNKRNDFLSLAPGEWFSVHEEEK